MNVHDVGSTRHSAVVFSVGTLTGLGTVASIYGLLEHSKTGGDRMPESRVYEFQIDGTVTTRRLLRALKAWSLVIHHVGRELGSDLKSNNQIQEMSGGSAITAFEVQFEDSRSANIFTSQFENVLLAAKYQSPRMESDSPLWSPVKMMRSAAIADITEAKPGMLWRNPNGDFVINPALDRTIATQDEFSNESATEESVGVVVGVLQSLSARGGFRAVVYDSLFDRAVAFSIPEHLRADISNKWDKHVEVVGTIRRDSHSGRPLSMLDVMEIEEVILAEDPWAWKKARGILRDLEPRVPSEDLIRRLRDE